MTFGVSRFDPTSYTGPKQNLVPLRDFPRQPTTTDKKYPIGQHVIIGKDPISGTEGDIWYLAYFDASGDAIWHQLSIGAGSPGIDTITSNSGGAVSPDGGGDLDLLGDNTSGINIVGTPASNLQTVFGLQSSESQRGTVELATAIETGTLTDATRAITPASLAPILVSPFVVAPGGAYTTIQSALDAANAVGGGVVWVRPGTYTEDLTLYDNTQIVGAVGLGDLGALIIIGEHTPPTSGSFVLRNCKLQSATNIFSSNAAGTSSVFIIDVAIDVTNGYVFNLPNWTASGGFAAFDIGEIGSTDCGWVNNTGGATVFMTNITMGAGSANSMITSGFVELYNCVVQCPVDFQTGTNGIAAGGTVFENTVTFSNNSSIDVYNSSFVTGSNQSILYNTTGNSIISNVTINSSNNPCIGGSGTGTLTLTDVSFINDSNLAGTLTLGTSSVYPVDLANGELLIGSAGQPATAATLTAGTNVTITNGAGSITIDANSQDFIVNITALDNTDSPYVVLSTDFYMTCNVTSGVLTIQLPNAPTTGRIFVVKDANGNCATNNITVTTVGGVVTIDGSTSFVMNTNYESANFLFNGASYEVW